MRYGLRSEDVKRIINQRLDENPDIYYYVEDGYIKELINLLSAGVADAIEENNKKIIRDLSRNYR